MKGSNGLLWRQAFSVLLLTLGVGKALAESPKLNRVIAKEPAYQSKSPKYGLLKFDAAGLELAWLVLDGDTLFVDRNGNGDLTEPDERIAAKKDSGVEPGQHGYTFDVGQLTINGRKHLGLNVGFAPLRLYEHPTLKKLPAMKAALAEDPQALGAGLLIDVETVQQKGGGIGGRWGFNVGPFDLTGVLRFTDSPTSAPVIDFAGPLQLTFCNDLPTLRVGRSSDWALVVAASGVGPGTFANLRLESIPTSAKPIVRFSLPPVEGSQSPNEFKTQLLERCCGVNLHGPVRVPTTAVPGPTTVELSLDPWQGFAVASTKHLLAILPESVSSEEPVASNLIASLGHSEVTVTTPKVLFSPDGTRLFASHYPSGVVQIWNLADSKEIHQIETLGRRRSYEDTQLSPDWLTLYVPIEKRKLIETEQDGQRIARLEITGETHVIDVLTGQEREPLKPTTAGGVAYAVLSPDGRWLWTIERLGYDQTQEENSEIRSCTVLWNLETRESWKLCDGFALPAFSPDGKTVVYTVDDDVTKSSIVKRVELTSRKELASRNCPKEVENSVLVEISPDGRWIAVNTSKWGKGLPGKFWLLDAQTLEDRGTLVMPSDPNIAGWARGQFTPDSQQLIATGPSGAIMVWDVAEQKVTHTFPLAENSNRGEMAFSKDSKKLAIVWQSKSENEELEHADEPDPSDLPQPRVSLYDLTGKAPPRVLIAPHGFMSGGIAFSPDGKTLALGGVGTVHLFDLAK